MGVLSDARIIEKIYDESIIISPFIYDHVQPASVDLTLGKKIKIPNRIENAVNVYDEQQEIYEEREIEQYTLKPNDFIIAFVRETIQLPASISGFVKNRSSLARVGLDVSASSYVNPGYHGQMTINILKNYEFFSFPNLINAVLIGLIIMIQYVVYVVRKDS